MSEVGVAYVRLVPSMAGFSAAAAKGMGAGLAAPAKRSGREAGQGFVTGFGSSLQRGGRTISAAGDTLTKGLTLPLLGLGALAFKASRDFNAGMANIATLIPGNTARVNELKTGVQDLAIEVGKSTSDMSDGLYQVISAFGDSSESLSILDINARAATAGLATTEEAINLTSAVTKGYGDTSAEAIQQASDLALLTVRMGQTTFPDLAASMGQVIPIAQNLGVSQEELFASMATFTGVTGSASEVATQMRAAMQALMAPTTDAAEVIEEAGFASGAAAIEELGLADAIALLTDAADESGKPLQKFMGQVEGQTFALGLAGAQAEDYETKLAEMGNAAGTTDEAFAEATGGVNEQGFQWEQAKVRAEVLAQRLGDGLAPALGSIFDASEPLVTKISELSASFAAADPSTQKLILGAVGIVAALGPVMSILGRITTAVGGTIKGFAAVGRGSAKVAKGAAKGARGLGRLASGFRDARAAESAFSGRLGTLGGKLRTGVNAVGRFSAATARGTARAAASFGRLTVSAATAGARVAASFATMAGRAAAATGRVVAQIGIQVARWAFLGVQALINAAKVAAAWLISLGPIAIVGAAVVGLVALIIANWDKVTAATSAAFRAVTGAVGNAIDWVKTNWPTLLAILTGPIGLAALFIVRNWDTIKQKAGAALSWIGNKVSSVTSGIRSAFGSAKQWVIARFNEVADFFARLPGRVLDAFSGLGRSIVNGVRSLWNSTVGGFGFSVPGWVPGVGGREFRIPTLATGGIATGPMIAMIGEGAQDEAVVPLDSFWRSIGSGFARVAGAISAASRRQIDADSLHHAALIGWLGPNVGKPLRFSARMLDWIDNATAAMTKMLFKTLGRPGWRLWEDMSLRIPGMSFANGGIARARRGGVFAQVAEAGQDEAIAPLSRLDDMIRSSVASELVRLAGDTARPASPAQIELVVTGGDAELVRLIRKWVRTRGGGDVQVALGPA